MLWLRSLLAFLALPGTFGFALPIWIGFMKAASAGRPAVDFPRPPGIVSVRIDPATGLLALPDQTDAIDEEYLDGTAPTELSKPTPEPAESAPTDDEAAAATLPAAAVPPVESPDTGTLPEVPPLF